MLPRKAKYLTNDIKLLGQQIQVPINFPKDFFSVILDKGEENGLQMGEPVEGSEVGDFGPGRRGWVTNVSEPNSGKTQDQN